MRVGIKDIDQWQLMTATHFIVIKVMGGGDLHAAGTKVALDIIIGNDRHFSAGDWQGNGLADQMRVTLVFWIDRHRGIAK